MNEPLRELAVIVPVRNGAGSLPELLDSLDAQTLPRERFEVIVVDNGSTDSTADIAERRGATVVRDAIANRARARNLGAERTSAPLYAFTDADCVAHPEWLQELSASAHLAPLVAGEVRLTTSVRPNPVERFEALWRFGQENWVAEQGWAATANLLVRADAFRDVGGFDDSWRHIGEDVDFCLRAGRRGHGLAFCPEAVVEHRGEDRLGPMLRRCYRHGYSVNQAFYRLGAGYRAWRAPWPALRGDGALRGIGHDPERFEPAEWRRMARLARAGYAARVAGSIWAELSRAR